MTTAENLIALKNCYALWHESKGQSTAAWLELMDDNIDFKSLAMAQDPSVEFTTPCCSKEQVVQYLQNLTSDWTMEHYTVDDFVVDDDRICMIGSTAWTNNKTGKRAETPKLDYVKFRDGKIIEFFEYYDTATLISAAHD